MSSLKKKSTSSKLQDVNTHVSFGVNKPSCSKRVA